MIPLIWKMNNNVVVRIGDRRVRERTEGGGEEEGREEGGREEEKREKREGNSQGNGQGNEQSNESVYKSDFKSKNIDLTTFYRIFELLKTLELSEMIMDAKPIQKTDEPEGECQICMDQKIQVILPCSHGYCQKCIDDWNKRNNDCPICRQKIGLNKDQWQLTGAFKMSEEEYLNLRDSTIKQIMQIIDSAESL